MVGWLFSNTFVVKKPCSTKPLFESYEMADLKCPEADFLVQNDMFICMKMYIEDGASSYR